MDVKIVGYFDGSLKNKIGIGAWHLEIMVNDKIIETNSGHIIENKATSGRSNRYEFLALVELLKEVKKYNTYPDLKEIVVRGDCKGVFDCLNTDRAKPYKYFKESIRNDVASINVPLKMEWISRKYNKKADSLCRDAYKSLVLAF